MNSDHTAYEFEFKLTRPIEVEGGTCDALILSAPAARHRSWLSAIESIMSKASEQRTLAYVEHAKALADLTASQGNSDTKEAPKTNEDASDGEQLLEAVKIAGENIYPPFCEKFKEFFTAGGVAKTDTGKPLAPGYYDALSYKDSERLMAEYIDFFMVG